MRTRPLTNWSVTLPPIRAIWASGTYVSAAILGATVNATNALTNSTLANRYRYSRSAFLKLT